MKILMSSYSSLVISDLFSKLKWVNPFNFFSANFSAIKAQI